MGVPAIGNVTPAAATAITGPARDLTSGGTSFGEMLSRAVDSVEGLTEQAEQAALKLAAGEPVELHEAMIALEEADLALRLTLQVRNKLVEAYQEIMRMQV